MRASAGARRRLGRLHLRKKILHNNNRTFMSQIEVTRHTDVYPEIHSSSYSREEFEGKVVIVTGGGNCLGRAAGLAFAKLGSSVVFADIIGDDAESAAKEARDKFGVKAIGVTMDVCKLEDNERLVKTVERELGAVDCVVFSAVKARWDTIDLSTSEDWWSVMETNLKGPVDLTRLLVPGMLKRNTGTFIYHASRVLLSRQY
jgi:NAD(P)-dependent dehydrogenase (short-subunit alcohol dehydrogenase family)